MTEYVRLHRRYKREVLGRHTAEDGREYVWLIGAGGGPSTWYASDTEPWVPEPAVGQVWRLRKGNGLGETITVQTAENGWVGYTYGDGGDGLGSCRTAAVFTDHYVYVSGPDA